MNYQLPLLIAVVLIVVIGGSMAAGARDKRVELERRLSVTERKLNQVLTKLALNEGEDIKAMSTPQVPAGQQQANQFGPLIDPNIQQAEMGIGLEAVQDSLLQGRKIEAIKIYRQLTGVGLKEAKEAVERMAGQR